MRSTTYLYDDPHHPDRVTGTVEAPDWTDDDRGLLLALQLYEGSLCPGCGKPVEQAWHTHSEGEWDTREYVCYACTSADDGDENVTYAITRLDVAGGRPWPPFELDVTTESP